MSHAYHQIAFTDAVKAHQDAAGSRGHYASAEGGEIEADRLGPLEAAFVAERDSFYIASVSQTGWPYLQHRGGPPGFVRVRDERTLAFAEYRGNRQYVTTGNLDADNRVALFFMDYPRRRRLKVYGHAKRVSADAVPELVRDYDGSRLARRIEGAMLIRIAALDWNCPQYIIPRYTAEDIAALNAAHGEQP